MRKVFALALCIVSGSCFAADPPSPVNPGDEWGKPTYKKIPENEYEEERWDYLSEYATLHIMKQVCSTCEPVGRKLVEISSNYRPTEMAVLASGGKYPAIIEFSIEPLHHIIFSYGLVTGKHSYTVQLVMVDSIPARESMRLQQSVLRMVSGWEPE